MEQTRRIYKLNISAADVGSFLGECERSEWYAYDTGERVMTDDGPDAEAVLLVEPVARPAAREPATLLH